MPNEYLIEYIRTRYQPYEPIFSSDLDLGIAGNSLRPMLKALCDSGKLCRYDMGVFYLPGDIKIKGLVPISANTVAKCKYIEQKGRILGYYSGFTFANQIGLTLQVPFVQEIVSNEASAKVRAIEIKNQKFMLRKPKTKVTQDNYLVLQFLDLLADLDKYVDGSLEDVAEILVQLVKKENITKEKIDAFIGLYPTKVYKNLYETGVVYAIA